MEQKLFILGLSWKIPTMECPPGAAENPDFSKGSVIGTAFGIKCKCCGSNVVCFMTVTVAGWEAGFK